MRSLDLEAVLFPSIHQLKPLLLRLAECFFSTSASFCDLLVDLVVDWERSGKRNADPLQPYIQAKNNRDAAIMAIATQNVRHSAMARCEQLLSVFDSWCQQRVLRDELQLQYRHPTMNDRPRCVSSYVALCGFLLRLIHHVCVA